MSVYEKREARSIDRGFVMVSDFLGALAGGGLVSLIQGISPDPWDASRWVTAGILVLAVITVFVLAGRLLLWLLRLFLSGN